MTLLTAPNAMREGTAHLGYPEYFAGLLVTFEILGALSLIIPQVPSRIKEWAYTGFAFLFIWASYSHLNIDGMGGKAVAPLVFFAILALSYIPYHQRSSAPKA